MRRARPSGPSFKSKGSLGPKVFWSLWSAPGTAHYSQFKKNGVRNMDDLAEMTPLQRALAAGKDDRPGGDMSDLQAENDAINRSQAVIYFEPDGTIITANENFLGALGYSLSEVQGQHHRMFCEDSYTASPEYKQFWQTLASGQFQSDQFKRIGKTGNEIWIQASYNPMVDENGKVYRVVKYASDITAEMVEKPGERRRDVS
ncbi:MAG: PAS domain-containing protein [Rhodospirillales bacterium]|nr:PAS domain-containing protein [Rhodospirillales bacterium]